jgi:regulator of cell morphogenesis and NO signaling
MMNLTGKSIGQLAVEMPHIIGTLERWKIDYCCQGGRSIDEALASAGMPMDELVKALGTDRSPSAIDWSRTTLQALLKYILDTHHVYTRQAVDTVWQLAHKVATRHGQNHAEVLRVRDLVVELVNDLMPHMMKEEQVLFPYVADLERAVMIGEPMPQSCFGAVGNPIQMMLQEHDRAGELLVALREATAEYALPADACLSFRALYEQLQQLEEDLHRHIHLENNVLFPRALDLERSAVEMMSAVRA